MPNPAHVDEDTLNNFLEGSLFGPERKRVERHLSRCQDCLETALDTRKMMKQQGLAGAAVPHHALEEMLSYLQVVIPLPFWALNLMLFLLTFALIGFLPEERAFWWGSGSWSALLPFCAEALAASYFFVALAQLRRLPGLLLGAGIPLAGVSKFINDYAAPFYSVFNLRLGKLHLNLPSRWVTLAWFGVGYSLWILTVTHGLHNLPGLLVLVYLLLVKSVWMMTVPFYIPLVIGLVRLLNASRRRLQSQASEALRWHLHRFINGITIVVSLSVSMWMYGATQKGDVFEVWGVLFSGFLLFVVVGDLYCERRFFYSDPFRSVNMFRIGEILRTVSACLIACVPAIIGLR